MPLQKSASDSAKKENFEEFGKGPTYARTKRLKGKKAADKQRVAVVLSNQRRSARRKSR